MALIHLLLGLIPLLALWLLFPCWLGGFDSLAGLFSVIVVTQSEIKICIDVCFSSGSTFQQVAFLKLSSFSFVIGSEQCRLLLRVAMHALLGHRKLVVRGVG